MSSTQPNTEEGMDFSDDASSQNIFLSDDIMVEDEESIMSGVMPQQDLQLMLLGTPSAVRALSMNKGPCAICDEMNHPTLRCHLLGEENVPPAVRLRFDQLKHQLEKQKDPKKSDELDDSQDTFSQPQGNIMMQSTIEGKDDADPQPIAELHEHQPYFDALSQPSNSDGELLSDTSLQEHVMTILMGIPNEVNALSLNRGPCEICGQDHPTLRCSHLTEENIPSAMHGRLQELKLQLGEQQKRQSVSYSNSFKDISRATLFIGDINEEDQSSIDSLLSSAEIKTDIRIYSDARTAHTIRGSQGTANDVDEEAQMSLPPAETNMYINDDTQIERNMPGRLEAVNDVDDAPISLSQTEANISISDDVNDMQRAYGMRARPDIINVADDDSISLSQFKSGIDDDGEKETLEQVPELMDEEESVPTSLPPIETNMYINDDAQTERHISSRLEIVNDLDDAPIPLSQIEANISINDDVNDMQRVYGMHARPDIINDADDTSMPLPQSKSGIDVDGEKETLEQGPAQMDEEELVPELYLHEDVTDEGPIPPHYMQDIERATLQTMALVMRYLLWIFTGIEPPSEEIDPNLPTDINRRPPAIVARPTVEAQDDTSALRSRLPILEATLVEDGEVAFNVTQQQQPPVYDAVRIMEENDTEENNAPRPCWKRYKRLVCAGRALVMGVLVISTTVLLIERKNPLETAHNFEADKQISGTESNRGNTIPEMLACVCSSVLGNASINDHGSRGDPECTQGNELHWQPQRPIFSICVYPSKEAELEGVMMKDEFYISFSCTMRHLESNISKTFTFKSISNSSVISDDGTIQLAQNSSAKTIVLTTLRPITEILSPLDSPEGILEVTGKVLLQKEDEEGASSNQDKDIRSDKKQLKDASLFSRRGMMKYERQSRQMGAKKTIFKLFIDLIGTQTDIPSDQPSEMIELSSPFSTKQSDPVKRSKAPTDKPTMSRPNRSPSVNPNEAQTNEPTTLSQSESPYDKSSETPTYEEPMMSSPIELHKVHPSEDQIHEPTTSSPSGSPSVKPSEVPTGRNHATSSPSKSPTVCAAQVNEPH